MTLPGLKQKLILQAVSSSYPSIEASYRHGGYEVGYEGRLVRTGINCNYYDSKAGIQEGLRMTTAGEELAIQLALERAGRDSRKVKVFGDLFVKGPGEVYMWQWTETGLRIPKGRKADAYETDAHGRKYWARVVLIGDQEAGEILVPEGDGRLVAEWDEVFGVPQVTIEEENFPHMPYTSHFWFGPTSPDVLSISDYDVSVARGGCRHRVDDQWCLSVNAYCKRMIAVSDSGFRPVRGSLPEIRKDSRRNTVIVS